VDQVRRAAMVAFRLMPAPLRRAAVRAGTPSYTVGAVAVLRRDDRRVLLVDQRHSGGWALPGGLLRRGESPNDAVIREVGEEVGIELSAPSLPVPVAAVNARLRRVDLVYLLDAPAGADPHQEDEAEVRRVGWYPLDALPDVSEPTLEILRTVRLR
jgi:ADP-ribose pyrophosphatase YjhB (NUDIX family)